MRILITAFEPFGPWITNASQLAVAEFLPHYAGQAELVVQHYPVRFAGLEQLLCADLADVDAALLIGQSSRAGALELETVALNVYGETEESTGPFACLSPTGPLALASQVPLERWCRALAAADIPAEISHHAGTYLCNAAYYYALAGCADGGQHKPVAFVHVPLAPQQHPPPKPQGAPLATSTSARALQVLVELLEASQPDESPADRWT